jgi:glycosyltransferase involved in cell wall biosynthesis
MQPNEITIAITVYDRREFISEAIQSALNQTVPVKVIVVEDCGPDLTLRSFIESQFGSRIRYVRNPKQRGLFGNWNACLEHCDTPWLSILHDDDFFRTTFVETMLKLHEAAPGCGLYFGNMRNIDTTGRTVHLGTDVADGSWQRIDLRKLADSNLLGFAGHLMRAEHVRKLGGFRAASRYAGDWEMWFRLAAHFDGAQTGTEVAVMRVYNDRRKGTSKVSRTGENFLATIVQRKRNYAYLKRIGLVQRVDVWELRKTTILTVKFMLWYGKDFSPHTLAYNAKLLLVMPPQSHLQRLLRIAIVCFGARFITLLSKGLNTLVRQAP